MILYHQTDRENWENIKKEGFKIRPLNEFSSRIYDIGVPEGIFLKSTKEYIELSSKETIQIIVEIPDTLYLLDIGEKLNYLSKPDLPRYITRLDELDILVDIYNNLLPDYGELPSDELIIVTSEIQKLYKEDLQKQGYDGIKMKDDIPDILGFPSGDYVDTIIIFEPKIIKIIGLV